jgi:hypothetical protein
MFVLIIVGAVPAHRTGLLLPGALGILAYPIIHIFTGTVSNPPAPVPGPRLLT